MAKLCDTIEAKAYRLEITKPEIHESIITNLKHDLYDWQKDALLIFLTNEEVRVKERQTETPNHLMFNMATGSGKTMIMAALILYYFKQGRRHFIFFTNRNNIVDKTQNNFVNSEHSKYLFKDKIVIDDKTIVIKSVNNFSDNPQGIEIKFTSIQKLYNDIHIQKESQTTLDDLHKKDIVMLADEAHHLNATTQKQESFNYKELTDNSSKENIERLGWEHTIIQLILNRNRQMRNNKNVLLEFTATIPENNAVLKKYEDKTISEFTLKEFLGKGYTKEISLLSSSLDKKERILFTLAINWYRHAIALDYGIPNFKPVILFRSKTIDESKEDYELFLNLIDSLEVSDFNFLKTISDSLPSIIDDMYINTEAVVEKLLHYIKDKDISDVVYFIKRNFKLGNTVITNSKQGTKTIEKTTGHQEKQLNSLEDKDNHIRAIFTVKRLTEGWDVLNLYDIVRLYEGQNAGGGNRTPPTTIEEKQLIGRGVRYYPFTYEDKLKNKRKFDENANHELRILEELFYYTDNDLRYISHIKLELQKDGYLRNDNVRKFFSLKNDFIESDFYKNKLLWKNEQEDNPNYRKKTLTEIKENFRFEHTIESFAMSEEYVVLDKYKPNQEKSIERFNIEPEATRVIPIEFLEIEKHIFRKAVAMLARQDNSVFEFKNLKGKLDINSIDDLQKNKIFGDIKLNIILPESVEFEDIANKRKCKIVVEFLDRLIKEFDKMIVPKIGSKKFISTSLEAEFGTEPKEKFVKADNINTEIPKNKWYVLDTFVGTGEEVDFINYFKKYFGNLRDKYKDIYLLRNEEVFKIYDFEKGRGFQPDFLLFLTSKEEKLSYQIFIEPKGSDRKTNDDQVWKQKFLKQLTEIYGFENKIEEEFPNYRLIGFPFYNTDDIENLGDSDPFAKNFQRLLC